VKVEASVTHILFGFKVTLGVQATTEIFDGLEIFQLESVTINW